MDNHERRAAVIGSGFGGSVMACRLAESGKFEVHLLERGSQYGRNGFPRRPHETPGAFWDPDEGYHGLFEYRSFDRTEIDVLTASGLGGGSLIYSNVLYRMPARHFATWPGQFTRELLDPYYDRVLETMEARPYPMDEPTWPYRATPKANALREVNGKLRTSLYGHPPTRLEWPPLAIQFGPEPGRERINAHGVPQTTCVMCGECNVGCNTHAKNTLDLNYIARARSAGAQVRTHCEVRDIVSLPGGGYELVLQDPRYDAEARERYDVVIVSAGSLGSTLLLLRGQQHALTGLSPALGTRWSPNGDLLGFVFDTAWPVYPTRGPVITGALRIDPGNYPDGFPGAMWLEDGGFPDFLAWYVIGNFSRKHRRRSLRGAYEYLRGIFCTRVESNIGDDLSPTLLADPECISNTFPLLGMGCDRAGGRMWLDRRKRWHADPLRLTWNLDGSEHHYDRMHGAMGRFAEALGGRYVANPLGMVSRLVSVHPLGGCPLGTEMSQGVVDAATAQVFGYPSLYVVDGSILPNAVGPNPSLTIAALAEFYAERLIR